jgi:hypothetical protein
MAKTEYFDDLLQLLERCTEETRKANITFLGGSPKWTARHFKGRADIRGCMNTMLVHKTKPSQADLLLEDSQDKKLVKQLHNPGEAVLADINGTKLTKIPFCTRQDMEVVAHKISQQPPIEIQSKPVDAKSPEQFPAQDAQDVPQQEQKEPVRHDTDAVSESESVTHTHDEHAQPVTAENTGDRTHAQPPSDEELLRIMQAKKDNGVTVSEMARAMNFERTYLSKWLNEKDNFGMTPELRTKLLSYLGLNLVEFPQGQRA